MTRSTNHHIIIVGAGLFGVCTAYYLLTSPAYDASVVSVTLIERDDVAAGASGKAGGFLAKDWHGHATGSLALLSWRLHNELDREFGGKDAYGFRRMTSVGARVTTAYKENLQPNPALEFSAMRKTPSALGSANNKWLDRTDSAPSVLSTEETTAQVEPLLFTHFLFQKARKLGLHYYRARPRRLVRNSAREPTALEIEPSPVEVEALASDAVPESHHLPCAALVISAGPWSAQIAKLLDIEGASRLPLGTLSGFSVLMQAKCPIPATAVFASISGGGQPHTDSPELFPRPAHSPGDAGLVYIAGENGGVALPASASDVESLVSSRRTQKLVESARRLSTALDGAVIVRESLCFRPTTPDGAPMIGFIAPGVLLATGAGPWGITLGPGAGHVIAEVLLQGAARSAAIDALDPSRYI